jgi:hypothetical protein
MRGGRAVLPQLLGRRGETAAEDVPAGRGEQGQGLGVVPRRGADEVERFDGLVEIDGDGA